MLNDHYRTGASLVRALVYGVEGANLVLSDFFEEHGLPNRAGTLAGQTTLARTLDELRRDPKDVDRSRLEEVGVRCHTIGTSFMYVLYSGPQRTVWVGTWPLWAWNEVDELEDADGND
jgi:hypothetical protein